MRWPAHWLRTAIPQLNVLGNRELFQSVPILIWNSHDLVIQKCWEAILEEHKWSVWPWVHPLHYIKNDHKSTALWVKDLPLICLHRCINDVCINLCQLAWAISHDDLRIFAKGVSKYVKYLRHMSHVWNESTRFEEYTENGGHEISMFQETCCYPTNAALSNPMSTLSNEQSKS